MLFIRPAQKRDLLQLVTLRKLQIIASVIELSSKEQSHAFRE